MRFLIGHNKGHSKPHSETAKKKMRCAQEKWRKTQEYQKFIDRQRLAGEKSKTLFKKGHKIHELHPELKKNIQPYQNGKNHWHWLGGITPAAIAARNSNAYREWREKVFIRDNYTCVFCGARSGKGKPVYIEADHIIPFSISKELRFNIDNGRTLCKSCHRLTDTYGNRVKKRNGNNI